MGSRSMSNTEPVPAPQSAAAAFYQRQRADLLSDVAISDKRMFGTTALCVGGKVFLFPWREALVLKLPPPQVEALVACGDAVLFDPGHGRTSKSWAAVSAAAQDRWSNLALDAREFVAR
jgi:hypothetical protein